MRRRYKERSLNVRFLYYQLVIAVLFHKLALFTRLDITTCSLCLSGRVELRARILFREALSPADDTVGPGSIVDFLHKS